MKPGVRCWSEMLWRRSTALGWLLLSSRLWNSELYTQLARGLSDSCVIQKLTRRRVGFMVSGGKALGIGVGSGLTENVLSSVGMVKIDLLNEK